MSHLIDYYQLEFIDQKLRDVMRSVENKFGSQIITSLYRIDDSGVHGQLPLRGTDIRCRNIESGEEIANEINDIWIYDPIRPEMKVAIAHGDGSNYHIHLQVHPRTVKKS